MKINAVRVAAFKRFAAPAALEQFDEGINVFAGPNELGKSTMFSALEAAFVTRHKVTGVALADMRPYSGGEPLVEVDFTRAGVRWRIRKQFGRGNTALLTNLDTAHVASRNAEAEEQLAEMIGKPGDTPGPLGLVWVPQKRMIMSSDLDFDVKTGTEKKRGERSALDAAIRLEIEAAASSEALQRVQQLTATSLNQLLTDKRNAIKKNGPLDQARSARDETQVALQAAMVAVTRAEQRSQKLGELSRQLQDARDPVKATASKRDLEGREAAHAADLKRREDFKFVEQALKAKLLEVTAAEQAIAAARQRGERLASLEAQAQLASDLERDIAALSASLNSDAATRPRLDDLAALNNEQRVAEAGLANAPARIELMLEADATGRVTLDGAAVSGRLSHDFNEVADIAIDGIGRIRVAAPGAEKIALAREKASDAARRITDILSAIGVATLAEARERHEARQRNVEALDRARGKLTGVAPNGRAALAEAIALLRGDVHPSPPSTSELQSLQSAAHVARERYDTLKIGILSDEAFQAAVAELQMARTAEAASAELSQRLAAAIENLKAEQAGAGESGLQGEAGALVGTLERLELELARLEAEAKALRLLEGTLQAIAANAQDAFFEPVLQRLHPHITQVFGNGSIGFDEAFAIARLSRDGQHESFKALSDGTQEQLSVLVRVAFAELIAQRGEALPIVLDDPLVYADDERLARVCGVLETAASNMQVIVLTCRPAAFHALSGHRVALTTWRPEI